MYQTNQNVPVRFSATIVSSWRRGDGCAAMKIPITIEVPHGSVWMIDSRPLVWVEVGKLIPNKVSPTEAGI